MNAPALQFVEEAYTDEEVSEMMAQFREEGYVVLPDVLKRETVDPFVEQLEKLMYNDGLSWRIPDDSPHYIHCVNTPRGYQVLPHALSYSAAKPFPCLHTTIVVIQKGADDSYIPGWHKDREPEGMPDSAYHWPLDVFIGFYFEDMKEEHGPTVILPGSHRDGAITPYSDTVEPKAIYCRKQDALLLDQRAWHRGTPRTADGNRFLIVYGYFAMPHFYNTTFKMPKAQRTAWMNAGNMRERILYGGPFAPPDQDELAEMSQCVEEKEKSSRFRVQHSVAY